MVVVLGWFGQSIDDFSQNDYRKIAQDIQMQRNPKTISLGMHITPQRSNVSQNVEDHLGRRRCARHTRTAAAALGLAFRALDARSVRAPRPAAGACSFGTDAGGC